MVSINTVTVESLLNVLYQDCPFIFSHNVTIYVVRLIWCFCCTYVFTHSPNLPYCYKSTLVRLTATSECPNFYRRSQTWCWRRVLLKMRCAWTEKRQLSCLSIGTWCRGFLHISYYKQTLWLGAYSNIRWLKLQVRSVCPKSHLCVFLWILPLMQFYDFVLAPWVWTVGLCPASCRFL